jgi:hypothetical protein
VSVLRYLFMFDNARATTSGIIAATASGVFPTHRYEYEQTQALRQSNVQLTGASYDYDQLEGAAAPKANGNERVRFLDVGDPDDMNADIDMWKSLPSYGRGRIWTQTAPGSGLRWAWARLTEMPSLSFTVENRRHAPVILNFERSSDWYDAEPVGGAGEFAIGSDPDTISVTNPGTESVRKMVITVKDPTAQPFKLTNSTTGYVIEHNNFGAWFRFDTGRNTVETSTDSGATWDDDSTWFVRQDGQVGMMVLAPGANSIIVDNVNGGDVIFEFYGAYA